MAQASKKQLTQVDKKQTRQDKKLRDLEKREQWMRWIIIGLAILVLLLLLWLGYATDWGKGLHKDSATDSANDSLRTSQDAGGTGTGSGASGSNGSGSNGSNGSNGTSGTSSTTSNTTTNNTTSTTPSGDSGLVSDLVDLYNNTGAGDNINDVLTRSQLLGLSKNCHNEILVQVCDFTDGELLMTTKNLLGTGLVTSVTKNF